MGKLDGKIALITGSASGIGRASALAFAQEGASVAVADWDEAGAKEVAQQIGKNACAIKVDVSKAADVEKMISAAVRHFGRLDILFNNAGVCVPNLVHSMSEEDWDRTIGINLKGVFLGCKYGLPELMKRGGVILNTASVAGLEGHCGLPDYCASKHGVIGLTKSIALDYAQYNIRANCLCPGTVATNIMAPTLAKLSPQERERRLAAVVPPVTPITRNADPAEMARPAVFLCSDDASFVTGHAFCADGGWMGGHIYKVM
ncbi:MAG TPA: SDR family oxidoreductase [Candidatus Binataceae bacterium]|jgi:NAD(P)-dependent dehydrogenase (short-subunit alcohol dehydrogenase family)|nr:SDR family oxidoreductase [Candidatus Binataceae bacterium]